MSKTKEIIEEMREAIGKIIFAGNNTTTWFQAMDKTDQILEMVKAKFPELAKEAGYVKLAHKDKIKNTEERWAKAPGPKLRPEVVDRWISRTGGDRTN